MMRAFLLLTIALLNSAWTDRVQLTNKYGSDGSDKDPIYEKNFGYLFCETKEDAIRARMGEIDWRRSKSDDYCRFKHRNSDDTWRSGWERSRLFRGCKNQLNMFGNAVYRCYDSTKDPAIIALEQQLNQAKADEYNDWLLAYQAKQKELLARAEELTGIEDMDAEIEAAKKQEESLQAEQQELLREAEEAKKTTEAFMEEFHAIENNISALSKRFDRDLEDFSQLLKKHSALEQETENTRRDIKERLEHNRDKWLVIQSLKKEWQEKISPSLVTLCEDPALSRALSTSQSQVAYMNQLLSSLEEKYKTLSYSPRFTHIKKNLRSQIDKLRVQANSRDFVFDTLYEAQTLPSSLCKSANDLWNEIDLAGVSAELIHRAEQVSSIREKLLELQALAVADKLQRVAIFKVKGQHSTFFRLIHQGRVREARELVDTISDRLTDIVANSGLAADSDQMKELMKEVAKAKEMVLKDSYRVGSLSSASIVLDTKQTRVRTLLLKAEMKSRQDAEFKDFWEIQKVEIYKELNTSPGQRIKMPRFKDWDELLQYELLLDQMEGVLRYIVEESRA